MDIKFFELRDRNLKFIPIMAINFKNEGKHKLTPHEDALRNYAGFNGDCGIILIRLDRVRAEYLDPVMAKYEVGIWNSRTLDTAHAFLNATWQIRKSGEVVDVEYILDETETIKESKLGPKDTPTNIFI
jgi:hypothetical protein